MDFMTFLSEVIKSLAWPVTVLLILHLFRESLSKLLLGLTKFRWKELEMEFKDKLNEAKAEAAELPVPQSSTESQLQTPAPTQEDIQLAEIAPRAAIIEAWLKVQSAASKAAAPFATGVASPPPFTRIGLILYQQGIIDSKALNVFNKLRELRNRAAHFEEFTITKEEALDYAKAAESLVQSISTKSKP